MKEHWQKEEEMAMEVRTQKKVAIHICGWIIVAFTLFLGGDLLHSYFTPLPEKETHAIPWLPLNAGIRSSESFQTKDLRKVPISLDEMKGKLLPTEKVTIVGHEEGRGVVEYWLPIKDEVFYYAEDELPWPKKDNQVVWTVKLERADGVFVYTPEAKERRLLWGGVGYIIAAVALGIAIPTFFVRRCA